MTALRQPRSAVKLWRDVSILSQAALGRHTAARRDTPSPRRRQNPHLWRGWGEGLLDLAAADRVKIRLEVHCVPAGAAVYIVGDPGVAPLLLRAVDGVRALAAVDVDLAQAVAEHQVVALVPVGDPVAVAGQQLIVAGTPVESVIGLRHRYVAVIRAFEPVLPVAAVDDVHAELANHTVVAVPAVHDVMYSCPAALDDVIAAAPIELIGDDSAIL